MFCFLVRVVQCTIYPYTSYSVSLVEINFKMLLKNSLSFTIYRNKQGLSTPFFPSPGYSV